MIVDSHCHAWTTWPYDTSVPDPQHRGTIERLLFEMDVAVQTLAAELGQGHRAVVALTGSYHNLLRMWADV